MKTPMTMTATTMTTTPMMITTKTTTKKNNHNNNNNRTFFAQERKYLISNVAITKIVAFFTRNKYDLHKTSKQQLQHKQEQQPRPRTKIPLRTKLVKITKESRSETIMVVVSSAGKIRIFNPDLLAFCGHCQSRTKTSIAHNHRNETKRTKQT